jgi:predicted nucleic acid-binding protein
VEIKNLFWDSCVFNAFLYEESVTYDVDSIEQYLEEARAGKVKLYTSSVFLAEIAHSKIKKKGVGGPTDFLNDFVGAIVTIDASVNVMDLAGKLKDIPYRKGGSDRRSLSTGDSVMLATALHLQAAYGVKLDAFHTFDDGGKKREVPLLSYHEWCEGLRGAKAALAKQVIDLRRERPIHPTPLFKGIGDAKKKP